MKKFAIIGVAGFVAPRHLKAIKDNNCELVAALDIHDSVGILDSYFPEAQFFTEFERFDRHISRNVFSRHQPLDYVSICTPNYLHDANIRFALRNQAHAICEKPLVLNPWNVEALEDQEKQLGKKVFTILQLRLHPSIVALQQKVEKQNAQNKYEVDLSYITSRGQWYSQSWKGDKEKSGGLASNIGVHFFDMLQWVFGKIQESKVFYKTDEVTIGYFEFEKAKVRWMLSIDKEHLPQEVRNKHETTYRSIIVNGEEIEFSKGFTDLHTKSYEEILNGNGFGLADALPSIQIIHQVRNQEVNTLSSDYLHPMANTIL